MCNINIQGQTSSGFPKHNPPLFDFPNLFLLSPPAFVFPFIPSCFIFSSICCRIQSARSQFSKPQVGTFPPPFPLTLYAAQTDRGKKKSYTFFSFQSAFHLHVEINRRSNAACETVELCDCEWEGEQTTRMFSSFILGRVRDLSQTTSSEEEDGVVKEGGGGK